MSPMSSKYFETKLFRTGFHLVEYCAINRNSLLLCYTPLTHPTSFDLCKYIYFINWSLYVSFLSKCKSRAVTVKKTCLFYTTSPFCSPAVKLSADIAIGDLSMRHCYSAFSSLSSASALIWRHLAVRVTLHIKEYKTGAAVTSTCRKKNSFSQDENSF